MDNNKLLLQVKDLHVQFPVRGGIVHALQGVTFNLERGRTLGVIGESGSGKSVTAQCIMQILPKPGRITSGQILYHPSGTAPKQESILDIAKLEPQGRIMRRIRGGELGMIFQEPMNSLTPVYSVGTHISESVTLHGERLNPVRTVGSQLSETLRAHHTFTRREARAKAIEMLEKVGLPMPQQRVDAYPHQLSGGQRQRVMIAIALSCNPSLLIADEPTTALDVTTQAQINELMRELQQEFNMAILYITHDMGVIAEMADDVVVMYLGQAMEVGSVSDIFDHPTHPYTQSLLKSIPRMGGHRGKRLDTIKGTVPDAFSIPLGCPFHTRCPKAIPGVCDELKPELYQVADNQYAACLLYDKKSASGEFKHDTNNVSAHDTFA